MKIQVLSDGSQAVQTLLQNLEAALQQLELNIVPEIVSDPAAIAATGQAELPALVLDGRPIGPEYLKTPDDICVFLKPSRHCHNGVCTF